MSTVIELAADLRPPMLKELKAGLMVAWISNELVERRKKFGLPAPKVRTLGRI
jgi:hypothetical protein